MHYSFGTSKREHEEEGSSSQTVSSSEADLGGFHEGEGVSEVDMLLAVGEGAVKKKSKPRRGEDFKFRETVIKADFWLLWLTYFLGVGSGATVLNSLAQIGVALDVNDTAILLSLFSFCNFLGGVGAGVVSEHFVRSKTIPRTFWMMVTQIIMIVTFLLYVSALSGTLYAATALLGICFGVHLLGNPIRALLFSGLLAGYVYDTEAGKQQGLHCLGTNCFRLTFQVLVGVSAFGAFLSIILTIRVRPVYQMLYAAGSFRLAQASDD